MTRSVYDFSPERYAAQLEPLLTELDELRPFDREAFERILRRYPKDGRGFFSKSDLIRGFRHLNRTRGWGRDEAAFAERLRMKPVRTLSGVAPVTVLTKPYPCPGRCVFCPSDVRMPKSYLSSEPGAQRAAQHRFDPWAQTLSRLHSLHQIGHRVDKVELIVLGGTWSFYPEGYQIWFLTRCFEAMNAFGTLRRRSGRPPRGSGPDFSRLDDRVDPRRREAGYNRLVAAALHREEAGGRAESATWERLAAVQRRNEEAACRCIGLVLETRPDHLDRAEVVRLRRLGATKVQIGVQSLRDEVLARNRRGHDVAATRRAMGRLRLAGFKIHAHWMPNLLGSSPELDREDFERLFADPGFRPDELKIYPCSLIESAELMAFYERGEWRPYGRDELLDLLVRCLRRTPAWCRVTRVVRDIPGGDIVDGNRTTNLRELVDEELAHRGLRCREIRHREVRDRPIEGAGLRLDRLDYATSTGREVFLQFVTGTGGLAGFLRLALPRATPEIAEIACSAMIREVHVYGLVAGLDRGGGGRAQHRGLGGALVARAATIAAAEGFGDLAVISSVGTRDYYRRLGFRDGRLYQHLPLAATPPPTGSARRFFSPVRSGAANR